MSISVKYNNDSRQSLKRGVDIVADAVKVTMGARGRNVIIDRGMPYVTKDGVTVANSIFSDDRLENMGVELVKEAARNTCNEAGDGTTTSTVLVQAIVEKGLEAIDSGYNPVQVNEGIKFAVKKVVEHIKEQSKKVTNENLREIAIVSANNDEHIGGLIADAFIKMGENGGITVKRTKGLETSIEQVKGIRFDKGLFSQYFATNDKGECELTNTRILITDKHIKEVQDILSIAAKVVDSESSLLIICSDMDVKVSGTLAVNMGKGLINCCVVQPPMVGVPVKEWFQDLAMITGGKFISDEKSDKLSNVSLDDLGIADKVIIKKNETTIIGCKGDERIVSNQIDALNLLIPNEQEEWRKDELRNRINNLSGYVTSLSIGGKSDVEIAEKADRVDDAIRAVKSAREEGVVPGGGYVYVHATKVLTSIGNEMDKNNELEMIKKEHRKDFEKGIEIIKKSLFAPSKTIANNAGINVKQDMLQENCETGYDVIADKVTNMYKAGIIDPAKVSRVALENAASVACILLTTECSIVYQEQIKENENK